MTTPDRIYQLLPAIHRMQDEELGDPLRQLLSVIESQLTQIEADITQLYNDMFIETCQGPLIDQFASLIAVHLSPLTQALIDPETEGAAWASRRHQVIIAIAARAAKGTLSALEQIAYEATGWPVRAVEQGDLLAVTQSVRFPDNAHGGLLDARDDASLLGLGTPVASAFALADVRRGSSTLTKPTGPHPTTVTVTAWRQDVDHVHRAPAACVNDDNHYTFDALGYDTQLAVAPTPRRPGTPPAGDLDLPVPITRRQLRRNPDNYYGTDRSLCVYRGDSAVPREEIVVADLSRWADEPEYGQVAVDPQTGRIAFPPTQAPEEGIWVRYHHHSVGPLGAGTTEVSSPSREIVCGNSKGQKVFRVASEPMNYPTVSSVTEAIDNWMTSTRTEGVTHGIVEIVDSGVYEEDFDIHVGAGLRLDILATAGHRPVLRSVDAQHNRPKRVRIEGYHVEGETEPARVRLSGITIVEHALEIKGAFSSFTLDHCTMVPEPDEDDRRHVAVAITAIPAVVTIRSSIIGWIRVNTAEVGYDPVELTICDSIIDAGPSGGHAIGGSDNRPAYATLTLDQSTVLGEINVFQTRSAQDSIITGHFFSRQRQTGEIRFCYLPPKSHVPCRTGCQPDGVIGKISDDPQAGKRDAATTELLTRTEIARVRPRFDSVEFGTPGYARLALDVAPEISHGAEDDGELGAYHDLWLTRRMEDMQARLVEFTPIGVDLDIIFAT
jgi:hypothetical protein